MKKLLIGVFSLLLFLTSFGPAVMAQSDLFYSQDHNYSLYFRGNGQAVVFARLIVHNNEEEAMSEFEFEIPGAVPSDLSIYQQILEGKCQRYNEDGSCQTYYSIDYGYSRFSSNTYEATYHAIDYQLNEGVVSFNIPAPINSGDTNAFILSYTTFDYVDKNLGMYSYDFESFIVDSRIGEISVAIDVETDYHLKGKQSEVSYTSYGFDESPVAYGSLEGVAGMSDTSSFSSAIGSIGNTGELVKENRLLEAGETYLVKGKYADSWWRLHLLTIVILGLVAIALGIGLYFLNRFSVKRTQNAVDQQVQTQGVVLRYLNVKNVVLGLVSSALIVGASHFISWFTDSQIFREILREQAILAPIMSIMVVIFYLLAIIGLPILGSHKKGWRTFLTIILFQFLWYVLYVAGHLIFALN